MSHAYAVEPTRSNEEDHVAPCTRHQTPCHLQCRLARLFCRVHPAFEAVSNLTMRVLSSGHASSAHIQCRTKMPFHP
jgi:hypothetical protein